MSSTLSDVNETLRDLQSRIEALEKRAEQVIILREIPRDRAKEEILQFFRDHPGSYPSDAAVALRLDAVLARDLARELIADGLLEG